MRKAFGSEQGIALLKKIILPVFDQSQIFVCATYSWNNIWLHNAAGILTPIYRIY